MTRSNDADASATIARNAIRVANGRTDRQAEARDPRQSVGRAASTTTSRDHAAASEHHRGGKGKNRGKLRVVPNLIFHCPC